MNRYFPSDELYVEEHPEDRNRVRICKYTGECGKWFSRLRHTNRMGYLEVPDFALLPDEFFFLKEHNT